LASKQTNLPYTIDESRGNNFILPCSLRHSGYIFVTWQSSSKNISKLFLNVILYILQGVRFFGINRTQWLGLIVSLKTMGRAILCALTANQTLFLTPCKGTSTVWGLLEHHYVLLWLIREKHVWDQDICWLLILQTACGIGFLLFSVVLTFYDCSLKTFFLHELRFLTYQIEEPQSLKIFCGAPFPLNILILQFLIDENMFWYSELVFQNVSIFLCTVLPCSCITGGCLLQNFQQHFFLCCMIFETIAIEHFLFKWIYFRSVLRPCAFGV